MKIKFLHLINVLKRYRKELDENDVIKLTLFVKNPTIHTDSIDEIVKNYVETKRNTANQQAIKSANAIEFKEEIMNELARLELNK